MQVWAPLHSSGVTEHMFVFNSSWIFILNGSDPFSNFLVWLSNSQMTHKMLPKTRYKLISEQNLGEAKYLKTK